MFESIRDCRRGEACTLYSGTFLFLSLVSAFDVLFTFSLQDGKVKVLSVADGKTKVRCHISDGGVIYRSDNFLSTHLFL